MSSSAGDGSTADKCSPTENALSTNVQQREGDSAAEEDERRPSQREVDAASSTVSNTSIVKEVKKPKRYKYQMPKRYAKFINEILDNCSEVDRSDVRGLILKIFHLTGMELPSDFPTEEQVRRRITGIKYRKEKKKRHATADST